MRVVWRGTISFGLVTIPVALYVATESKNVPSRQIHVNDGGQCSTSGSARSTAPRCPTRRSGEGYESTTGELVVLSDVDLAALPAKTSRSIEIVSFLPQTAVDPIYFDRSYYVEPERQGAKAYRLMRDALRKMGRLALAKVRLRDREILAVLRSTGMCSCCPRCCGLTRSGRPSSPSWPRTTSGSRPRRSWPWRRR